MDLDRIFMKNASPTKVGGQAILEGLMMRGSRSVAVAIRQPDGNIHLTVEPLKPAGGWKKYPIIRGVVSFVSSLVMGTSILMYGADVLEKLEAESGASGNAANSEKSASADSLNPENSEITEAIKTETPDSCKKGEEGSAKNSDNSKKNSDKKGFSDAEIYLTVAFSIVMVVALFILLPTFILNLVKKAGVESVVLLNLMEGILRILIFVAYVKCCTLMPEIKRTFEYHGAEHKTIHCYENGLELTPENAQSFYTLHPRCGTSFMMFVMIISLIVFSLFGWPNLAVRIITRLVFIPVIAGLSYEVLQWTGRHNNRCVKLLSLPGIMLQKLTTGEPSLDQLEVAIAAINAVLPAHNDPNIPVDYWVGVQLKDGTLVKNEAETAEYIASKEKK